MVTNYELSGANGVRCSAGEARVNSNNSSSSIRASSLNFAAELGSMSTHVHRYDDSYAGDDYLSCSGTETTRQIESPAYAMATQISQHGPAPQMRLGQRFLRLLDLVGILQREEHRRARNPDENENTELQDRVARFERALSHNQVPSTDQMRAAALRLVGCNNRMNEVAKSRLTLAFQTHFMLMRAARRRT
uniref:Uncharacterized protein n=1 Tax=Octactis speculum TaxID=3111310 RepID=A0A7S2AV65_9STRA